MARHLQIGISRLNRAIADYSLARLEFTIAHPDAPPPPALQRIGGPPGASQTAGVWVGTMKLVAVLGRYVDETRAANIAFDRDPIFDRLVKAIRQVGVLAWNMESMHRRTGGLG